MTPGSDREFEGRVCAVTGAGRGIGAAIAEAFGREGRGRARARARPRRSARRPSPGLRDGGIEAHLHELDVADERSVVQTAERVAADHGGIDVLVNNAGISRLGASMTFPAGGMAGVARRASDRRVPVQPRVREAAARAAAAARS